MSEFCHSGGASIVQKDFQAIVAGSSSLKVFTSQISVLRLTISQSVNARNTRENLMGLLYRIDAGTRRQSLIVRGQMGCACQ